MKSLKDCIELSCQVKIYVPSTVSVSIEFDTSSWVETTLGFLAGEFGGATATRGLGAWNTAEGKLITENITMVFAFATSEQLEKSIQFVYDYCVNMRNKLKQETIALEINGKMYFV